MLGSVNAVLTSFPDDPAQQYQTQCQVLLAGLKLPGLLQKEMDRLARWVHLVGVALSVRHFTMLAIFFFSHKRIFVLLVYFFFFIVR